MRLVFQDLVSDRARNRQRAWLAVLTAHDGHGFSELWRAAGRATARVKPKTGRQGKWFHRLAIQILQVFSVEVSLLLLLLEQPSLEVKSDGTKVSMDRRSAIRHPEVPPLSLEIESEKGLGLPSEAMALNC